MKYAVASALVLQEPGEIKISCLLTTHHHCSSKEQALGEFIIAAAKQRPGFVPQDVPLVQELGCDDDPPAMEPDTENDPISRLVSVQLDRLMGMLKGEHATVSLYRNNGESAECRDGDCEVCKAIAEIEAGHP